MAGLARMLKKQYYVYMLTSQRNGILYIGVTSWSGIPGMPVMLTSGGLDSRCGGNDMG